jgi:hypothetical protein
VREAVDSQSDLLIVHHPLFYRAVSAVPSHLPKGRVLRELAEHNIALYVAHTNADAAVHGVSESLAFALGLDEIRPLVPHRSDPLDKIVTYVPPGRVQRVIDAMAGAGAGTIGDYDRCAFLIDGEGTFRPGPVSNPAIGTRGKVEVVAETRVEMVVPRATRDTVVAALIKAHPYEEPAFDVFEMGGWAADRGSGRIGHLRHPRSLREFADDVASALPATAVGARVSGDLDREVSVVAVAGGAGDFLLDQARAHPESNWLGIEYSSKRVRRYARRAASLAPATLAASAMNTYRQIATPTTPSAARGRCRAGRSPRASRSKSTAPLATIAAAISAGASTGPHQGSGIRNSTSQSSGEAGQPTSGAKKR